MGFTTHRSDVMIWISGSLTLGEFSMYTPKDIAEAIAKMIPTDDSTNAMCDLFDRVASETGISDEALKQLMKEGFLLYAEKMHQFGEEVSSGKVVPLAFHRD